MDKFLKYLCNKENGKWITGSSFGNNETYFHKGSKCSYKTREQCDNSYNWNVMSKQGLGNVPPGMLYSDEKYKDFKNLLVNAPTKRLPLIYRNQLITLFENDGKYIVDYYKKHQTLKSQKSYNIYNFEGYENIEPFFPQYKTKSKKIKLNLTYIQIVYLVNQVIVVKRCLEVLKKEIVQKNLNQKTNIQIVHLVNQVIVVENRFLVVQIKLIVLQQKTLNQKLNLKDIQIVDMVNQVIVVEKSLFGSAVDKNNCGSVVISIPKNKYPNCKYGKSGNCCRFAFGNVDKTNCGSAKESKPKVKRYQIVHIVNQVIVVHLCLVM